MRIFVTGATGWIGSAVVSRLVGKGHSVVALIRSKEDADRVRAEHVAPVVASLTDDALLEGALQTVDGVIHTAMAPMSGDQAKAAQEDIRAIQTFGRVFAGSNRPIVVTHGLGPLTSDTTFFESARPEVLPQNPRASEQTAFELASRGINASVVRPARSVHGIGEEHGFVPMLAEIARKKGFSAWVGDGEGPWPACHRLDVARVFCGALERAVGGEAYHAVAEGVPFRLVAEAIGRQLGIASGSVDPKAASDHFGPIAMWVTGRGAVSTASTRERLNWEPQEVDLLTDIDRPEYFAKVQSHGN